MEKLKMELTVLIDRKMSLWQKMVKLSSVWNHNQMLTAIDRMKAYNIRINELTEEHEAQEKTK